MNFKCYLHQVMTPTSFPLQQNQIFKCVKEADVHRHHQSAELATESTRPECEVLYKNHQSFYKRSSSHSTTPGRFELFVDNVVFVYSYSRNSLISHQVALNQFSDLFQTELPFTDQSSKFSNDTYEDESNELIIKQSIIPLNFTTEIVGNFDVFQSIQKFFGVAHHSLVVYSPSKIPDHSKKLKGQPGKKWIVLEHSKHHNDVFGEGKGCNNKSCGKNVSYNERNMYDFVHSDDNWRSHLDWATKNNPDGVAIVHPPIDQVRLEQISE